MHENETLTAALARGQLHLVSSGHSLSSNGRVIPYAERYQASSGQIETPAEHIQRITDEDHDTTK